VITGARRYGLALIAAIATAVLGSTVGTRPIGLRTMGRERHTIPDCPTSSALLVDQPPTPREHAELCVHRRWPGSSS
jgi:hypothetical protein